ncbi:hypothetical protein ABR737_15905 [Streptomyces sp. Edi2]
MDVLGELRDDGTEPAGDAVGIGKDVMTTPAELAHLATTRSPL